MYLRLKPRVCATPPSSTRNTEWEHPKLSRDLYDALVERNSASYDWMHGGQIGLIKFVDLHQFEFATTRALKGSLVATIMVNLYLNGIEQLIVPGNGAACQYSIGSQWNNRNRLTTLRGQAVVLQALAFGARLSRRSTLRDLGIAIHRFVYSQATPLSSCRTASSDTRTHQARDSLRLRDNAWYALALRQFADAYELRRLTRDADTIFETTVAIYEHRVPAHHCTVAAGSTQSLDEIVAIAAALTHFGIVGSDRRLLCRAHTLIREAASHHAHADGGYCQSRVVIGDTDLLPDIDCTIELVRTSLALAREIPNHRLAPVTAHGERALFDPAIALARDPESGILLVAETEADHRPEAEAEMALRNA